MKLKVVKMNEFLLNCLKEIANGAQAIQLAIIAYIAYVEGSNDASVAPPPQELKQLAQLIIPQEKQDTSEIKGCSEQVEQEEIISVSFTEKELFYMPLQFRKEYRMDGTVVRCRKRPTGYNKFTYEMRYRRDGYNVTATAKSLEECKSKFLAKLKEADKQKQIAKTENEKSKFGNFALYYFETFKKRRVTEETYKTDFRRLNVYLMPCFKDKELKSITPGDCQTLIDSYANQGKGKTAEEIHSILNQIFKGAIKHNLIAQNPIDLVVKEKHEREHGKAFTLEEEASFISALKSNSYAPIFITALYTGMRPNEYEHAEFKDNFIITKNSKRKKGKIEYKKIPIHPMLAPYINDSFIKSYNALKKSALCTFRENFYKIIEQTTLTHAKLYDLRTTFYTRCQMCGVSEPARNEFVGHSGGILKDTYTDLPDSYLKSEGEKLNYPLMVSAP